MSKPGEPTAAGLDGVAGLDGSGGLDGSAGVDRSGGLDGSGGLDRSAGLDRLAESVVAAPARCGPVRVVAVDGGAAAGKSTLAAELARRLPRCVVMHLDDLLDGWAGQFSFAGRLRSQVLEPLAAGRPARYRRYDWIAGSFTDWVTVAVPNTLIVEGVSAIGACGKLASIGIFLDASRADRQQRWVRRDGPLQPEWSAWLDNEDLYFAEHPLPADTLVVRF